MMNLSENNLSPNETTTTLHYFGLIYNHVFDEIELRK